MTTEFAVKALALHNKYRANHNSAPLEWCPELQRRAQADATSLLVTGLSLMPKGVYPIFGQNVFEIMNLRNEQGLEYVDDHMALERAIDMWYGTIKDFDPTKPSLKGRNFSQLVWPITTKVGMGIARKQTACSLNIVVVAMYDPPAIYEDKPPSKIITKL